MAASLGWRVKFFVGLVCTLLGLMALSHEATALSADDFIPPVQATSPAQKEELSGRETARGVGDPAAGQFVADGDNFSCNVFVHGSSLLPGQCTRFRSSAQAPVSRIPNGPPASTRKSRTAAIFPTSASGPARRTGI